MLFYLILNIGLYFSTFLAKYELMPYNLSEDIIEVEKGKYHLAMLGSDYIEYKSFLGIIEMDKNGNLLMEKKFSELLLDPKMSKTKDLNYIFFGVYKSQKLIIMKINENLSILWQKEYDFSLEEGEYLYPGDIIELEDGFLITVFFYGSTNKRSIIMKISKDGDLIFAKSCNSYGIGINVYRDGFIYLNGSVYFNDNWDGVIIKLDKNLNIYEQKKYNIKDPNMLFPNAHNGAVVIFKENGNEIIYGNGLYFKQTPFTWIIEKNPEKGILWKKGFANIYSEFVSIEGDGAIILKGGPTHYYYPPQFFWIYKIDSNGNNLWQRYYDLGFKNSGTSVIKDSEGYFVFSGGVKTDEHFPIGYALIGRMDKDGNIEGCGLNPINLQEYNTFEVEETEVNIITFSDYNNISVSDSNFYLEDIKGNSEVFCRGKGKHRRPF